MHACTESALHIWSTCKVHMHTVKTQPQHHSPRSGQSRCCPEATGGIPRISPGPCWAAGGVTHHLLPEDTAAEYQNGTQTPEPTWGRFGSQLVIPRPLHGGCWGGRRRRRTAPVCSPGCESNRLNSVTSWRKQTHSRGVFCLLWC